MTHSDDSSLKTVAAAEAKQSFGRLLDDAQHGYLLEYRWRKEGRGQGKGKAPVRLFVCDERIERIGHGVAQFCGPVAMQGLVEGTELLSQQVSVDLEDACLIAQGVGAVLVEVRTTGWAAHGRGLRLVTAEHQRSA